MERSADPNDGSNETTLIPRVRVVVINHNAGRHLARCIAALRAQTFADFEAVIADNGSTDGSVTTLPPLDARFRIVEFGENLGFAAANNRAAAGAETQWIVTLNPDAFPEPDWLAALLSAAEAFPDVVMFGSTQISDADPSRFDGTGDAYFFAGFPWRGDYGRRIRELPDFAETFSPCAAAAMWRRDAFESAGGFDERYFCYCEDVDLGFRLRAQGERCVQVAAARVRHVGSASTGTRSTFTVFHGARNRIWTMVKSMPLPLLLPALPAHAFGILYLTLRALFRTGGVREATATLRGVGHALVELRPVLADRSRLRSKSHAGNWRLAAAMTWSPLCYLRRAADLRSISKP